MNPTPKKVIALIGKGCLIAAILASIISALGSYRLELDRLTSIRWEALALATLMCTMYRLTNAHGWWMVLDSLKHRLSKVSALRIWLIAEACRWLPGSVWSYGSRAYQAKRLGVPTAPACASLFLELFLTLVAWMITAVVGLILYRESFLKMCESLPLQTAAFYFSIGVAVVLVIGYFLRSALKTKFVSKFDKLKEQIRSLSDVKPNMLKAGKTFVYYTFMCFFNGVTFYYILSAVAPESNVPLMAAVGANAASWLVGFFAFMAPGGLVVREGALAALLAAWVPMELAIAAAVIWRLIQIAVELICMAIAYGIQLLFDHPSSRDKESAEVVANKMLVQPTA